MNSIIPKLPFLDARGHWWIYRDDDDRETPKALGPFFTPQYALAAKEHCQQVKAPFPLVMDHKKPKPPFTPYRRGVVTPPPITTASRRPASKIERF